MWQRIRALRVLLPAKLSWRQMVVGCGVVALVTGAFCFGRFGPWQASAQTTKNAPYPLMLEPVKQEDPGRPVAYIYGNVPITRQDLGEYLIARFGPERLDLLVNRKIIEQMCYSRGISVTEAEIESQLIEDLKAMNVVKMEDFVNQVLKRFGKTLYEYKEDILRPKIAMTKLVKDDPRVQATEQDIKEAFEARYGPMVKCRIIIFPEKNNKLATDVWAKVCNDEVAFKDYAKKQNTGQLAANGGAVPPIHKHFPDKRIEEEAFALKPGQVSSVIALKDGSAVILKCDELIPARNDHRLEDEYIALRNEVYVRKLTEAIPQRFQEMHKQADPKLFLQREEANPQAVQRINHILAQAALKAQQSHPPLPQGMPSLP